MTESQDERPQGVRRRPTHGSASSPMRPTGKAGIDSTPKRSWAMPASVSADECRRTLGQVAGQGGLVLVGEDVVGVHESALAERLAGQRRAEGQPVAHRPRSEDEDGHDGRARRSGRSARGGGCRRVQSQATTAQARPARWPRCGSERRSRAAAPRATSRRSNGTLGGLDAGPRPLPAGRSWRRRRPRRPRAPRCASSAGTPPERARRRAPWSRESTRRATSGPRTPRPGPCPRRACVPAPPAASSRRRRRRPAARPGPPPTALASTDMTCAARNQFAAPDDGHRGWPPAATAAAATPRMRPAAPPAAGVW